MPAIEILGLEKTYTVGFWRKQPKHALRPLNLTVEEGEIFGFLGPNGAGKTTTLKMLMGLIFPTAGSARILGMEIDDPRMKAQIGFLPEQPYFYDYLTARELLEYYGQLSGVDPRQLSRKVRRSPAAGWTARRRRSAVAQVFQRHAAASGNCTSHSARSQSGFLRRTHVRPGSHGPPRGARSDGAVEARGQDGFLSPPTSCPTRKRFAIASPSSIKGELRGVGAVADLTSSVHGQGGTGVAGHDGAGIAAGAGRRVSRHRRYGASRTSGSQSGCRDRCLAPGAVAADFGDSGANVAGRLFRAEAAAGRSQLRERRA